ncbi:MAG: N-6 DNA methylase, partial [Candidatus Kryptonium sp.]
YAMAKMNVFIHDMSADIRLGDSMRNPAFLNNDGSLKKFDIILANPMWNQKFPQSVYDTDPHRRFTFGFPPESSADWGWIQHMYASLKENGKMLVVLLPENLFYNTTAPGVIIVINKNKVEERKGKVLFINISELYEKGRPKNYLPESTILKVYELYSNFKEEEGISKIVGLEEIARNDYNLSPS